MIYQQAARRPTPKNRGGIPFSLPTNPLCGNSFVTSPTPAHAQPPNNRLVAGLQSMSFTVNIGGTPTTLTNLPLLFSLPNDGQNHQQILAQAVNSAMQMLQNALTPPNTLPQIQRVDPVNGTVTVISVSPQRALEGFINAQLKLFYPASSASAGASVTSVQEGGKQSNPPDRWEDGTMIGNQSWYGMQFQTPNAQIGCPP
jgi:hypothetical protein